MRAIHSVAAVFILLCLPGASEQARGDGGARSHCASTERVYFNCLVAGGEKIASLCGSDPGPDGRVTGLEYRFGSVGQVEFRFPRSGALAGEHMYFESQRTRDYSTQDYFLWFRNGAWIHEVYYREEFESCTEERCPDALLGQAAMVSVWRGAEAWRTGDTMNGRRHACTDRPGNEVFKSLDDAGLRDRSVRAKIFTD